MTMANRRTLVKLIGTTLALPFVLTRRRHLLDYGVALNIVFKDECIDLRKNRMWIGCTFDNCTFKSYECVICGDVLMRNCVFVNSPLIGAPIFLATYIGMD